MDPRGADPIQSTSCTDAKRLRCSTMLADPMPKVLDNDNASSWPTPPPLDDENLLQEILIRLPPKPSSLLRASLVCKCWRRILSDRTFLKRYRKHHRTPPVLGFFPGNTYKPFIPSGNEARSHPSRALLRAAEPLSHSTYYDRRRLLGCRHGLAVLIHQSRYELLVWDPLTGQLQCVPFPPGIRNTGRGSGCSWHAVVLCADAEDGHVHGDCFSSPLKLVLMGSSFTESFACLYESVSGVWGNIVSKEAACFMHPIRPSILIGNAVYWLRSGTGIVVFDIESQTLGVIKEPANASCNESYSSQLVRADDASGGLALAAMSKLSIQLWERKSNCNGVFGWELMQQTIQLEGLFPQRMFREEKWVLLVGYDEETKVIVLSTRTSNFMLQLESMQIRKISDRNPNDNMRMEFYPYTNFYTAGREVGWK